MNAPAPPPQSSGRGVLNLIALVGAACAAILVPLVDGWEGNELVPYQDIVNVWTNCRGNTKDVDPNKVMKPEECAVINEEQLIAHAKPVLKCTPSLKSKPNALAAAISLAYNVGPTAYCRSTVDRRFDAGNVRGACDAFLMWDKAGGRTVRGLTNRRKAERQICLRDA